MPVTKSSGESWGTSTGGGDTGGYDVFGTGVAGDPTRGGKTIQDISGGDSDDQGYVDAIRQNVQRQVELAQNYRDLVEQGRNIDYQNYYDLARRGGIIPDQFGGGGLLGDLSKFTQAGVLYQGLKNIGQFGSRQLMEGLAKGYVPQYNAIGQIVGTYDPKTGRYGAGTVEARIDPLDPRNEPVSPFDTDSGDSYVAPEATTVVAAQPEPEKSMIEQDYRYPAGGYYPEEGRFLRTGLLDVAPTTYGGLLAGYDPTQFGAMNVGFRQPTDVGLFVDPYDVAGYSLLA